MSEPPWEGLVAWLHRFLDYLATKQALSAELFDHLDRDAAVFRGCRTAFYGAGERLLVRAQQDGVVRTDVSIDDVVLLVAGISKMPAADGGRSPASWTSRCRACASRRPPPSRTDGSTRRVRPTPGPAGHVGGTVGASVPVDRYRRQHRTRGQRRWTTMDDDEIVQRIDQLADEEHRLERSGASTAWPGRTARLRELEVALDQCWDLLRQRRARRHAGLDPDDVAVRDPRRGRGLPPVAGVRRVRTPPDRVDGRGAGDGAGPGGGRLRRGCGRGIVDLVHAGSVAL